MSLRLNQLNVPLQFIHDIFNADQAVHCSTVVDCALNGFRREVQLEHKIVVLDQPASTV